MKKTLGLIAGLMILSGGVAFGQAPPKVIHAADFAKKANTFQSYWYRGLAEMNRFEVQQSRYGELHDAEAVIIFVTEDFLKDKQVKYEHGPKTNAVPIMKMLQYRRFWTGIYPYNITTTTFVPVADKQLQKLSFSQTDWCGQVFAQLNRTDVGFDVESRSYFQSEGDKDFSIDGAVIEDELWTRLRLDPESLPMGKFKAVPSMTFLRLNHKDPQVYDATASTQADVAPKFLKGGRASVYTVSFPELGRSLSLYYEPRFPYRILGFEETAPALFNPNGKDPETLTTTGVLSQSIMLDYWTKHGNGDVGYRQSFGLKPL